MLEWKEDQMCNLMIFQDIINKTFDNLKNTIKHHYDFTIIAE